jgi:hypothetical protein
VIGEDTVTDEKKTESNSIEERYPGITEQLNHFKQIKLPSCSHCGSTDTASVQVGIIGRTILLAGLTKKFKLVPNAKDRLGKYYCNTCGKFFD